MQRENVVHSRRLVYLDISRGMALILVVIGHALLKSITNDNEILGFIRSWIYLIHMPIFFMISGYLFENKSKKDDSVSYIREKAQLYLVPYIIYSILLYFISIVCTQMSENMKGIIESIGFSDLSLNKFIYTLLTFNKHPDTHLWFVYTMFFILLIAILTKRIKKTISIPISALLSFLTYFIGFPNIIEKIIRFYFIFNAGRGLSSIIEEKEYSLKMTTLLGLSSFCSSILSIVIREPIIIHVCCKLFTEIGFSLFIIQIGKIIESSGKNLIQTELQYIGKNSYPIYLIHQPYITPIIIMLLLRIDISTFLSVFAGIIGGIIIPLVIYKYILQKSVVLKKLFVGGR